MNIYLWIALYVVAALAVASIAAMAYWERLSWAISWLARRLGEPAGDDTPE